MNETIQRIFNIMPTHSLPISFVEMLIERLISLGYSLEGGSDDFAIGFAMQNVENHIKNSCNTAFIPVGLYNVAVDRICGEFLYSKKQTGHLHIADLDLSGAITSITEGDVSISFDANSTDEQKFNQLINYLMTKGEGEFVCYRKLSW